MPRVGVGSSHQLWGLGNAMKCHWKIFCILMSPDHMSYKLILSTTGTRMGVGRNHPIIPKDELRVMSWRSRWQLGMGLTPSNSNPELCNWSHEYTWYTLVPHSTHTETSFTTSLPRRSRLPWHFVSGCNMLPPGSNRWHFYSSILISWGLS